MPESCNRLPERGVVVFPQLLIENVDEGFGEEGNMTPSLSTYKVIVDGGCHAGN
jgi:hypothetical protein